jgi:hypothetical protein
MSHYRHKLPHCEGTGDMAVVTGDNTSVVGTLAATGFCSWCKRTDVPLKIDGTLRAHSEPASGLTPSRSHPVHSHRERGDSIATMPTSRSTLARQRAPRRNGPVLVVKPGETPVSQPPVNTVAEKQTQNTSAAVPLSGSIFPADFAAASGLEAEVVTVTPEMATKWLEMGGPNRRIQQLAVNRYAESMRRKEWRMTGEAIKLNQHGQVRDGQHRLWACIEADVPFTTLVVLNVPDDAFDVMDSGKLRNASDVLSIHNYGNTKALAAAIRILLVWERDGYPHNPSGKDRHSPITKPQHVEYLLAHPEIEEWVRTSYRIAKAGLPGAPSVFAATLYKLSLVDASDTLAFADSMTSGAGLEPGDPILALRNRLIQHATRMGGSFPIEELAALIIKAWNAMRRGESVNILVWRRAGQGREQFPVPV